MKEKTSPCDFCGHRCGTSKEQHVEGGCEWYQSYIDYALSKQVELLKEMLPAGRVVKAEDLILEMLNKLASLENQLKGEQK